MSGCRRGRSLNCWLGEKSFESLVKQVWNQSAKVGWGVYVFKEKLKELESHIKVWNKDCFGKTDSSLAEVVNELGESHGLDEHQVKLRKDLTASFWELERKNESILLQKSRLRWVREGYVNSKYFHISIRSRRSKNSIRGLNIGGSWSEEPSLVKNNIKEFFESKFCEQSWLRPTLDGVEFPKLNVFERASLVEPFLEEEIREAVWEYEGNKSSGLDGFNFNFFQKNLAHS
jgi:hypothetical protein